MKVTPHCYVCGRWDGSHAGGCPNTGQVYVTDDSPARCPTCKIAVITRREARNGHQCRACTIRDAAAYGDGFNDTGW